MIADTVYSFIYYSFFYIEKIEDENLNHKQHILTMEHSNIQIVLSSSTFEDWIIFRLEIETVKMSPTLIPPKGTIFEFEYQFPWTEEMQTYWLRNPGEGTIFLSSKGELEPSRSCTEEAIRKSSQYLTGSLGLAMALKD